MTKDDIRAEVKAQRRTLDNGWVESAGLAAQDNALTLPELKTAAMVGVYMAVGREVGTRRVMERCWAAGCGVCVPAFRKETGRYEMARLRKDDPTELGPARVAEPVRKEWIPLTGVDVMLVPGLAFDAAGGRVGHGGGHYDRTLAGAAAARPLKVGLAFEFQVFDRVPVEETDVRMDVIVTEKRVIKTGGVRDATR